MSTSRETPCIKAGYMINIIHKLIQKLCTIILIKQLSHKILVSEFEILITMIHLPHYLLSVNVRCPKYEVSHLG